MKRWIILLATTLQLLACSVRNSSAETLLIPHPDDPSKKVEAFFQKPAGRGPWPTIVLLHGHQNAPSHGGQDFVTWGILDKFVKRGYLAVAVSAPGYGNSTGPPDFCGPLTQHAVSGVIAKLKADGYVLPGRIVIQGVSRGALVAGLIAAHDTTVTGVVLISGVYDLPLYAARPKSAMAKEVVSDLIAETGGGEEALQARSVLYFVKDFKAAALILNGAKDDRTDPDQARRLAAEINSHGGKARAIVYPDYGHHIPPEVRDREIDPFIDGVLRHR